MKKLLYTLFLVLLACSCAQEMPEVNGVSDAGKVVIDFRVQINDPSVATKAMADNPQLKNLMLAVFDETGYLVEYTWAIIADDQYATENGKRYAYKAKLTQSKTPRIIHFIGNAPAKLKFGSEESVLASLSSTLGSENEDMYWYRKEIPAIEGTSSGGAMALAEGEESGAILQATPQTKAYLNDIPLIRNFAKIVLTSSSEDFDLESYFVVGTPKEGMAAAYNYSTGEFVDYFNYKDSDNADLLAAGIQVVGDPKLYEYLTTEEKYDANVPANVSSVTLAEAAQNSVGRGESYFVYEREKPLSAEAAAYIIAYGTYKGDQEPYYYKIDLRDNDGYFPILRNFQYNVDITTVSRAGYKSAEAAAKSTGSGDISSSMETISLAYISDGVASLEVGYTEMYLVSDDPVTLDFKFLTDVGNDKSYGDVKNITIKVNAPGATGAAIAEVNDVAYTDGMKITPADNPGVIKIKPTTPGDTPKTQTLTIYAKYQRVIGEGESATKVEHVLQRTVKYIVQTRREMVVSIDPCDVPDVMGSEFDMSITIPGGLSSSIFPLQFAIEAEQLTINPAQGEHMPVQTGESISGSGKSAFYFIKTLSHEEYKTDQENIIVCHFKTNKAVSETRIFALNKYFRTTYVENDGIDATADDDGMSVYLDNYSPAYFKDLKFSQNPAPCEAELPITFDFSMTELPANKIVKVSLGAGVKLADENDTKFKYWGVENGCAVYEYTVSDLSASLSLLTADADTELYVGLDADRFIHNEETANRDWMEFTNLSISPNRLLQGVGRSATISFRMDTGDADYANREVIIKLDGLAFADGKDTYTFKPVTSGNVTVTQNYNGATVTIRGLVTTIPGTVSFTVSAPGYKKDVAEKTRSWGSFGTLSYEYDGDDDVDYIPVEPEEDVIFHFNLPTDYYDDNMLVNVELDGFLPAESETRLNAVTRATSWIYDPDQAGAQSIRLRPTGTVSGTVCKVTISEPGYNNGNPASLEVTQSDKVTKSATLTFNNTSKRTERTNSRQRWTENDIVFVNERNNSSTNVSSNYNPVRIYKGQSIKVSVPDGGVITQIVFDCNSTSYAQTLQSSIGSAATRSLDKVTINLSGTSSEYNFSGFTNQVRLDAITVTYEIDL